nr:unnamed protein product [Spirometra erinaceieuropaei]
MGSRSPQSPLMGGIVDRPQCATIHDASTGSAGELNGDKKYQYSNRLLLPVHFDEAKGPANDVQTAENRVMLNKDHCTIIQGLLESSNSTPKEQVVADLGQFQKLLNEMLQLTEDVTVLEAFRLGSRTNAAPRTRPRPLKIVGGSRVSATSYRPVSLTFICCKIMEKIIKKALMQFLDQRHLLSDIYTAFEVEEKKALADATMLHHLSSDAHAQLILTTDASSSAVGAVLQQQVNSQLQPLAFLSQKLQPAQTSYSTFSREVLAIYRTIRHLQHLLDGRDFSVHPDHKPLTYALKAKPDRYSSTEVRHLDYISQFTADIRYVRGSDNVVADALSRPDINTLTSDFDLAMLADLQIADESIADLRTSTTLQLRDAPLPASPGTILGDWSTDTPRPAVPLPYRKVVFDHFHCLSHPGIRAGQNIAMVSLTHWISTFGVPATLTTDRGSQFQSSLFRQFTRLLGCAHITTTAYHPASNGLVKRLHRQLKSALMSQTESATWSVNLPLVLLGIRSSVKEDIQCTAAELAYGAPLRLPGEFVQPSTTNTNIPSTFVQQLKQRMAQLRPTPTRMTSKHVFVQEDLKSAPPLVFVQHDAVRKPLCPPYDGPYKVVQRKDKFYVLQKADKTDTVSIDRLRPAYLECLPSTSAPSIPPTMSSPDTPTPLTYPSSPHLTILPTQPDPPPTPPPMSSRSGRHVRLPAKLKDFVV